MTDTYFGGGGSVGKEASHGGPRTHRPPRAVRQRWAASDALTALQENASDPDRAVAKALVYLRRAAPAPGDAEEPWRWV